MVYPYNVTAFHHEPALPLLIITSISLALPAFQCITGLYEIIVQPIQHVLTAKCQHSTIAGEGWREEGLATRSHRTWSGKD